MACLAVQASGASPFWCVKATRDATLRQDAKYHQEHKKVLAQVPPQSRPQTHRAQMVSQAARSHQTPEPHSLH